MSDMTLGSLFDGSGGFSLGGILAGIKPVWATELHSHAYSLYFLALCG